LDIADVLLMPALCLRQRLGNRVEVVEREFALPADQRAPILPSSRQRDEVGRGCELDVEVQLLLEPRYLAQDLISIWDQLDVDVDGRIPPAIENRGCTTGEIDAAVQIDGSSQFAHELLDARGVG
jgi:hypothetical protein